MSRTIRYQGAILRNDHILLIKHREHQSGRAYWVIPGGGREDGETEEACVQREMQEETGLNVTIERLLLDEPSNGKSYERHKTYLCRAETGDAKPGYEPEPEVAAYYAIVEIGWFDLRTPEKWDAMAKADKITYPLLKQIQAALGYPVAE